MRSTKRNLALAGLLAGCAVGLSAQQLIGLVLTPTNGLRQSMIAPTLTGLQVSETSWQLRQIAQAASTGRTRPLSGDLVLTEDLQVASDPTATQSPFLAYALDPENVYITLVLYEPGATPGTGPLSLADFIASGGRIDPEAPQLVNPGQAWTIDGWVTVQGALSQEEDDKPYSASLSSPAVLVNGLVNAATPKDSITLEWTGPAKFYGNAGTLFSVFN